MIQANIVNLVNFYCIAMLKIGPKQMQVSYHIIRYIFWILNSFICKIVSITPFSWSIYILWTTFSQIWTCTIDFFSKF